MSVRAAGYTLLEMIVVMAVVAMATAVAAPPSYRMIRSWQEATDVADVIQQLERLPTKARMLGSPIAAEINAPLPEVELPEEWALELITPFQVQANGACHDSRAALVTPHQRIELEIQAPFCRTRRTEP